VPPESNEPCSCRLWLSELGYGPFLTKLFGLAGYSQDCSGSAAERLGLSEPEII
jgi:hypothetical protein